MKRSIGLVALASMALLATPVMAKRAEYYTLDKGGCLPGDTATKQPCCSGFKCKAAVRLNPKASGVLGSIVVAVPFEEADAAPTGGARLARPKPAPTPTTSPTKPIP
jgi:hypothetical protein